jgi:hypothetical protein
MSKFMYKHDFRPQNVEQLQQKIVEAWHEITPENTRNLVSSMPRRLQRLIDSNGVMLMTRDRRKMVKR